jgi:hypothetical protein
MAEQEPDVEFPNRIRRVVRTFSTSRNTQIEGTNDLPVEDIPPEEEPTQLNMVVREHVNNPLPALEVTREMTPRQKLRRTRRRASGYEKEFRLHLLHEMLLKGMPLDECAEELGISYNAVVNDRLELKQILRNESKFLDIDHIIGDNKRFYELVQGMALREAANQEIPTSMKLAAMRTAMASNADKHRFLAQAGVYPVLQYKKSKSNGEDTDIARMLEMTKTLLADDPMAGAESSDSEDLEL